MAFPTFLQSSICYSSYTVFYYDKKPYQLNVYYKKKTPRNPQNVILFPYIVF